MERDCANARGQKAAVRRPRTRSTDFRPLRASNHLGRNVWRGHLFVFNANAGVFITVRLEATRRHRGPMAMKWNGQFQGPVPPLTPKLAACWRTRMRTESLVELNTPATE